MIVMHLGPKPIQVKAPKGEKSAPPRRIMFADVTGSINGAAFGDNMTQINELKSGQVTKNQLKINYGSNVHNQ